MTSGDTAVTYTYGADGLRLSKTVDGVTHHYVYSGGKLVEETFGNIEMQFIYDAQGYPMMVRLTRGSEQPLYYHYVVNLQGDVIRILKPNGAVCVTYQYDAWGNITRTGGPDTGLAQWNPLRYRGYVYDTETGLYYLQSRYYNPKVGRFINADGYVATGQGVLSSNMFAYCGNNPVSNVDYSGESWISALFSSDGSSKSSTNVVKYNIPLYNQGIYKLCWAYCQVMFESWNNRKTLTSKQAFNRAKEIAIEQHGNKDWNKGGWPSNLGAKRNINSLSDLYYLVRGRGPVYAYYNNGKQGVHAVGHLVLVTGVDLDKGYVYTNNPWGVSGKQTFKQFQNGVLKKWYHSGQGMKFVCVYLIDY